VPGRWWPRRHLALTPFVRECVSRNGQVPGAHLGGSVALGANFTWAQTYSGTFTGASFNNATMTNVNFPNSGFTSAYMVSGNFPEADFTGANFANANLNDANLSGANVSGVIWANTTCPSNVAKSSPC
jgi:uncharacterized protein YjbI with pentapeptide repeats